MASQPVEQLPDMADEAHLVRRALARDASAFRSIMQTYNRYLYRLARGILRNDADAEDAVQQAYLSAFTNLVNYRGEGSLKSWLSRIVINESLGRIRQRHSTVGLGVLERQEVEAQIIHFPQSNPNDDPERTMAQRQILHLVEQATDDLPDAFRLVFMARVIEGLTVEETSGLFDIKPETVKTRLHRARQLIRDRLESEIGPILTDAFPFAGRRCERLTSAVLTRLGFTTD
jgi:RNA polymerase sigma-70 factor, ECF subfamily